MMKTILVLPDGREIASGAGITPAIQSCTYTQSVNAGNELELGSVCASMVELGLWDPDNTVSLAAGDRLTVYKVENAQRRTLGVFLAEKPERPSRNVLRITAYDPVVLLDQDLTQWLAGRSWPCTLEELAHGVCQACGAQLLPTPIPNGSFLVQPFTARGITGRQLMRWIGQIAGRFCRATPQGTLELAWYTPAPTHIIDCTGQGLGGGVRAAWEGSKLTLDAPEMTAAREGGKLTLHSRAVDAFSAPGRLEMTLFRDPALSYCYLGGLKRADYATARIDKVQLQKDSQDVGVLWPRDVSGGNTYRITGNPLLTGEKDALEAVAQTLYTQLRAVIYTPCTLTLPAGLDVSAGQILHITDAAGHSFRTYIMERRQSGQRDTLTCTGSHRRDSATAVNDQSYAALSGKVLHLQTDVDGIRAENSDTQGRMATLRFDLEGIDTQVRQNSTDTQQLRTDVTQLQQTARDVRLSVQSVLDNGVSKVKTSTDYTFDERGLSIAKSGQQMENRLDNTGMYVTRSGQALLTANSDGVTAADVKVENYLILGKNARFEDYTGGRTACFYIGG